MRRRMRFSTISATLPVEEWNAEAGFFRFGLPQGWHSSSLVLPPEPDSGVLTGVTNWQTGDPRAGELPETPRPYLCMFVLDMLSLSGPEAVREIEQIFSDPDGLARYRAGCLGQRPMGTSARILLDGSRAVLLHYAGWDHAYGCGSDKVNIGRSEVFTLAPGDRPLLVMYQGALEQHQRCLPELNTMLGTWQWLAGYRD